MRRPAGASAAKGLDWQAAPDRDLRRAASAWARGFSCHALRPLIICRGPIRKEAMDVFASMGIRHCGILLSERDSVVYPGTLAPELRGLANRERVHPVADYGGASAAARAARIDEIVDIARRHDYDSVFAGYGFMAEDAALPEALAHAGLRFIGPGAGTVRQAGFKDEAKRVARALGVSVTPGVDDLTRRTLLARHADLAALRALAKRHRLGIGAAVWKRHRDDLPALADALLGAARARSVELFSLDALCERVAVEVASLREAKPGYRIRLKAIGGGGGKGQRILSASAADRSAGEMLREILSEVKATGPGDDKNVLLELNIENTRHLEIQLLGNADWCVSLGGRDCSVQMHEQKLLEVSLTEEGLAAELARAEGAGDGAEAAALRRDAEVLARMEDEACRFGAAVGLDSASTFECIVERSGHFFMEMNTRIQVEHRVTELCYGLRFAKPDDPNERFSVDSLVQAMALIALHGDRLPEPERVPRRGASVEARVNATNPALAPHAGGVISHWSEAERGPDEILDEQGLCTCNPDTGAFIRYTLSGAYDSNIALLLTSGEGRRDSYAAMAEALRRTRLRGQDLATNLSFHYGLVNWLLAHNANARPGTGFMPAYLTAVGLAAERCAELDLASLWQRLAAAAPVASAAPLAAKQTLLLRPLGVLFADAHRLAGWMALSRADVAFGPQGPIWRRNPVEALAALYRYLKMDWTAGRLAAHMIWEHDQVWLADALDFYRALQRRCPLDWPATVAALERPEAPTGADGLDPALWASAQDFHRACQCGMAALALPACIAADSGFEALRVADDLSVTAPERLLDADLRQRMLEVLAPPPASADMIVAQSGGMFYARSTPDAPPFLSVGSHFEPGDPLYVIEVMKMFTTVRATFAGAVEAALIDGEDGLVVRKGQPLFKVSPDQVPAAVDGEASAARQRAAIDAALARLAPDAVAGHGR